MFAPREGFEGAGLRFQVGFILPPSAHAACGKNTARDAIPHFCRHVTARRHHFERTTLLYKEVKCLRAAAAYGHVPLDGYPKAAEEVWGPDGGRWWSRTPDKPA
jgi:hypothetical protein